MNENKTRKSCYWCKYYIAGEDMCEMCAQPLWGNDNPCSDYDDGSQQEQEQKQ